MEASVDRVAALSLAGTAFEQNTAIKGNLPVYVRFSLLHALDGWADRYPLLPTIGARKVAEDEVI